jgi:hypothetical protein
MIDLVEDRSKNRLVFVLSTLLAYLYLTWTLYINSAGAVPYQNEIEIGLDGPSSLYIGQKI